MEQRKSAPYSRSTSGSPDQSADPKSRGPHRRDTLNEEVFGNLAEARAVIERWRLDFNHVKPHSGARRARPDAVRLNPAAGRLRNVTSSTAGAGDQLPTPRSPMMIEGPAGSGQSSRWQLSDAASRKPAGLVIEVQLIPSSATAGAFLVRSNRDPATSGSLSSCWSWRR